MVETEEPPGLTRAEKPDYIEVSPEQVLTAREAHLQRRVDAGLSCPKCGQCLMAAKVVTTLYTGLVVNCIKCNFVELG